MNLKDLFKNVNFSPEELIQFSEAFDENKKTTKTVMTFMEQVMKPKINEVLYGKMCGAIFHEMVGTSSIAQAPTFLATMSRPSPFNHALLRILDDNGVTGVIASYDNEKKLMTLTRGAYSYKLGDSKEPDIQEIINSLQGGTTMKVNAEIVKGYEKFLADLEAGTIMTKAELDAMSEDFRSGYISGMEEKGLSFDESVMNNLMRKLKEIHEAVSNFKINQISDVNDLVIDKADPMYDSAFKNFATADIDQEFATVRDALLTYRGIVDGYREAAGTSTVEPPAVPPTPGDAATDEMISVALESKIISANEAANLKGKEKEFVEAYIADSKPKEHHKDIKIDEKVKNVFGKK